MLCLAPAYIFGFGGHDAHIHGLWGKAFSELLYQGYLYPRLANDMNAGFGTYTLFFYPPMSLYIDGAFMPLADKSDFYFAAISYGATVAVFLSGVTAYYWLRSKVTTGYAIVYALLYMVLPMHLLVDFYITAGVGQVLGYAWLPMIMYGVEKTARRERFAVPLLGAGLALLVATNIPMAMVFIPAAMVYGVVLLRKHLLRLAPGCLLGMAMVAVYALPVAFYQGMVNTDLHWTAAGGLHYDGYFLDMKLFTGDVKESYRVTVLLCGVLTYLCLSYLLVNTLPGRVRKAAIGICGVALFMCFSVSNFVWEILTPLQIIQFPRRILVVPSLFILLMAGHVMPSAQEKVRNVVIALIIIFLVAAGIIAQKRMPDMKGEQVLGLKKDFVHNVEAFPVYMPGKDLIKYFYPLDPRVANAPQAQIDNGDVMVRKWESRDIGMEVSAKNGAHLKVRQFYFPYWKAYVNGRQVPIARVDPAGMMQVTFDHDAVNEIVQFKLETLPAEKMGIGISAVGFLVFIFLVARYARKKPL